MKCIYTYFRNGKELPKNEWEEMLKRDFQNDSYYSENKSRISIVYRDLEKGYKMEINNNFYQYTINYLCDSAKELFDDLRFEGMLFDIIVDIMEQMTEEELFNILSKSKNIDIKDKNLLLKDIRFW